MKINLIKGTLKSNDNMDGWIITSKTAVAEGADDLPLKQGDRISINGDVRRNGKNIGNIS
jgi:hypothetical protein